MKKFIPLTCLLLLANILLAQQKRVKGKVIDTLTHEPVESAVITDPKTNNKGATDKNGNYVFNNIKSDSV